MSTNPWEFRRDLWNEKKTIRANADHMNIPYHKALAYCKHYNLKYVILHQSPCMLRDQGKESISLWEDSGEV